MKILHFSYSDINGGASKAAYRLHLALQHRGLSSQMIVKEKHSEDPSVIAAPANSFAVNFLHATRHAPWRKNRKDVRMNRDRANEVDSHALLRRLPTTADIVCIHSIWRLLRTSDIRAIAQRYGCPIVRVIMDQEAVTGGCHYSFDCNGYTKQCGWCPEIGSHNPHDMSRRLWERKRQLLGDLPISFICPTGVTLEWVQKSSLFPEAKMAEIGLAIDDKIYFPRARSEARRALGIDSPKKIVFLGSASLKDPRKGMKYLVEALHLLRSQKPQLDPLLLIAGSEGEETLSRLPYERFELGYIRSDKALAEAYCAADLFVCPSVEDAGPMMIPEAMMCGTPVVAFRSGGAPDLIQPMINGYLADYKSCASLADGIAEILTFPFPDSLQTAASAAARARHHPPIVAERCEDFFRSLLINRHDPLPAAA